MVGFVRIGLRNDQMFRCLSIASTNHGILERFFDEIQGSRVHGLYRHGYVPVVSKRCERCNQHNKSSERCPTQQSTVPSFGVKVLSKRPH